MCSSAPVRYAKATAHCICAAVSPRRILKVWGNYRFCPEDTLTRAEAAVMLARLTNYSSLIDYPACGAADVPVSGWYAHEVDAFYDAGIEAAPYFRPDAPFPVRSWPCGCTA